MNIVKYKFYQVYESTIKIDMDKLDITTRRVDPDWAIRTAAETEARFVADNGFRNCDRVRIRTLCVRADEGPQILEVNKI